MHLQLEDMTQQEILDKVVAHLMKQGKRAMAQREDDEDGPLCAYRNNEGLSCAIGCLLTDEEYKVLAAPRNTLPGIEGSFITDWKSLGILPLNFPFSTYLLLGDLQKIHDFTEDKYKGEGWREAILIQVKLLIKKNHPDLILRVPAEYQALLDKVEGEASRGQAKV